LAPKVVKRTSPVVVLPWVGINWATATGPGVGTAHATSPETAKQVHVLYIFNLPGEEVDAFGHEESYCNVFLQISLRGMARPAMVGSATTKTPTLALTSHT
jgi:hypothetical protein